MKRAREKNLDDHTVSAIVEVLDGWSGHLTWEALIAKVTARLKLTYTRQALHRHERIRLAFTLRKNVKSTDDHAPDSDEPPELRLALDRIARLEAENIRLTAENHGLLEQFARWAYNAHARNVSQEVLNTPLPRIDRARSKRPRSLG